MKPKCIQCLEENLKDPAHRLKEINCAECDEKPRTPEKWTGGKCRIGLPITCEFCLKNFKTRYDVCFS